MAAMAWPDTRLTNYAPGVQIKSADLNALQDAISGRQHGEVPFFIHPMQGFQLQGPAVTLAEDGILSTGGSLASWFIPLPWLPFGSQIKEVEADQDRSAGGTFTVALKRYVFGSATTASVGSASDAASGARAQLSISSGLAHTMLDSNSYALEVTMSTGGIIYHGTRILVSKP